MSRFVSPLAAALAAAILFVTIASAAEPPAASTGAVQDLLAAEQAGLAHVRYIPNDSRSAQILVANRSDRPLTLRLPAAFAGVPVLAQQFGGGMGMGGGGLGAAPQTVGGGGQGAGQQAGGGAFGGFCWVAREVYGPHDPRWVEFRTWMTVDAPRWLRDGYVAHGADVAEWIHDRPVAKQLIRTGMDAAIAGHGEPGGGGQFQVAPVDGAFVVLPGRQRTLRFATVCLEHGKPEPSPRFPYKLVALDSYSQDSRLPVVLAALAAGRVSQKTAQAAAWHIANGLSWERLAAEAIAHAGGVPDEPFFAAAELRAARGLVAEAERQAAAASAESSASSPTGR